MELKVTYLDNAATTFPKPESVYRGVNDFLREQCANPGRSAHKLSLNTSREIFQCRELLKSFFNAKNSENIIFTQNATEALNLAILGFLKENALVLTTGFEHNSVMRPLNFLKQSKNINIIKMEHYPSGKINEKDFIEKVKLKPEVVIVNHASNVNGVVQNLELVSDYKRKYNYKILIDASQSAGVEKIDLSNLDIDFFAFTGHKSLYGIQGAGGLYVREPEMLTPIKFGGTGSLSEKEVQPDFLPDRFESGTLNCPAIKALLEGVSFIKQKGVKNIKEHKKSLLQKFIMGVKEIKDLKVYFGGSIKDNIGVVSVKSEKFSSSYIAMLLDSRYSVAVRPGLHCAPSAHISLGTFPEGTVRFSFSIFNTTEEVDYTVKCLKEILCN